ncbi:MAG: DUF4432 family protein [Hoeflea sp.]|uniref:DUF4432 family protein n=1 Tax=Hoeflea sp. TaxID=1940281 RepID=UPI0027307A64|nr:DUF4432 family protein [Hoeflea sp.]MDP2118603.1 DUF4432 family protein [Hoeflea sp.]
MTGRSIMPERRLLSDYTGDRRQLASVRRIRLDDGPEQGQQALVFSTGGGLDFWVLNDRSMDIGPLWFEGMPIAWQHPNGYVAPGRHDPESDNGTGIERALSGFLVTCGLSHTRQPSNGQPLHGRLPLTPARLTACGEDWDAPVPMLYAQGEMVSAHLNGDSFRLTRRIEAPIGGQRLSIIDRVENIGMSGQELQILYHTNFGFPAVGHGTTVRHNGVTRLTAQLPTAARKPEIQCHPSGDGAAFHLELERSASGPWRGLLVSMTGPAAALPFVQVWSDPRPRRNLLALEPASSGRAADGTSLAGPVLEPNGTWQARLDFNFSHPAECGGRETRREA